MDPLPSLTTPAIRQGRVKQASALEHDEKGFRARQGGEDERKMQHDLHEDDGASAGEIPVGGGESAVDEAESGEGGGDHAEYVLVEKVIYL